MPRIQAIERDLGPVECMCQHITFLVPLARNYLPNLGESFLYMLVGVIPLIWIRIWQLSNAQQYYNVGLVRYWTINIL